MSSKQVAAGTCPDRPWPRAIGHRLPGRCAPFALPAPRRMRPPSARRRAVSGRVPRRPSTPTRPLQRPGQRPRAGRLVAPEKHRMAIAKLGGHAQKRHIQGRGQMVDAVFDVFRPGERVAQRRIQFRRDNRPSNAFFGQDEGRDMTELAIAVEGLVLDRGTGRQAGQQRHQSGAAGTAHGPQNERSVPCPGHRPVRVDLALATSTSLPGA
jgi:hypothetical protein